jgi:hypothetical protein
MAGCGCEEDEAADDWVAVRLLMSLFSSGGQSNGLGPSRCSETAQCRGRLVRCWELFFNVEEVDQCETWEQTVERYNNIVK